MPLAAIIWLVIIWAFGFLLTSPKVEVPPPAPIEASFVELPEEKPQPKAAPVPKESPKGTSSSPASAASGRSKIETGPTPSREKRRPPG